MKKIVGLFLLIPFLSIAQYDFDTRYFKMDAESLYDLDAVTLDRFNFEKKSIFTVASLKDFSKVTSRNYWQPVDMMTAIDKNRSRNKYASSIRYPQQERKKEKAVTLNLYSGNDGRNSSNGVRNIAYKEMRTPYYCSPLDTYNVQN